MNVTTPFLFMCVRLRDVTRCQILRKNAQTFVSNGALLQTHLGDLTALPQTHRLI